MHRDQDVDLGQALPANEQALTQDLELDRLFAAMARGDAFLLDVARRAVLSGLTASDAIAYRQHVLRDCLEQEVVVREIYELAVEAVDREKREYIGIYSRSPDLILNRAVRVLEIFTEMLGRLRRVCDEHAGRFGSEGFVRLFGMLSRELDDEYLHAVEGHLKQLRLRQGVLISAELGEGNRGVRYVLREAGRRSWKDRVPFGGSAHTFQIPDRDESGFAALAELRGRGINLVANALAQSTDHILSFFSMLRSELGFYVGCLNLHRRLAEKGEPTCFPVPLDSSEPALACQGLYDVSLSLILEERVVGNDVIADGKSLVTITGANQGGKSTFLRSVGQAQLMMQCGMFVAAESFRADVRQGVFTHFKREEDATMRSGKLDEELGRMSEIADAIGPGGVILFNESFASTNEREGSEIARQIIRALLEAGVKILFVTHMFDLAGGLHADGSQTALFLRAQRQDDGRRTFRLVEGAPLPTSYGADLYRRIFGTAPEAAAAGPRQD